MKTIPMIKSVGMIQSLGGKMNNLRRCMEENRPFLLTAIELSHPHFDPRKQTPVNVSTAFWSSIREQSSTAIE